MKNLFFALAFMLMGTFAFANNNDVNSDMVIQNETEVLSEQTTFKVAEAQEMYRQDDVYIIIYEDGTVVIIIT